MRSKDIVAEQLSMFGLKPTARIANAPAGQIALDVFEITCPPKELLNYDKRD